MSTYLLMIHSQYMSSEMAWLVLPQASKKNTRAFYRLNLFIVVVVVVVVGILLQCAHCQIVLCILLTTGISQCRSKHIHYHLIERRLLYWNVIY